MNRSRIPADLRRLVSKDSGGRCGYCLSSQQFMGTKLVPDHIRPIAKGGESTRDNLWMACRRCNEHKGARTEATDPLTQSIVPLFNPRFQIWSVHFAWDESGSRVEGLTSTGRTTIKALNMNDPAIVLARSYWVQVGWHPPHE